jgi:uncharacterized spore protein YtfJ
MAVEQNPQAAMNNHTVEQVLTGMAETARADAVFGEPVERGDSIVIPCSEVFVGMGFGMGMGGGGDQQQGQGSGGGAGAGGTSRGRPVAAIIISPEGVRVEPIVDVTKVVLASLTTGAFMLLWLARLSRAVRGGKGPSFSQLKRAVEG